MVGIVESKMIIIPDEFRSFDYPAMIESASTINGHQWSMSMLIGDNVPDGMKSFLHYLNVPWEERKDLAHP